MADPITLRTDSGDEQIDVTEFEMRVTRGEVSPQSLVRFLPVTGERFVQACELELYQRLHSPKRAYFTRAFSVSRFPWITSGLILLNVSVFLFTAEGGHLELDDMVRYGGKVGPLVKDLGEVWRLLTANVLHRDALHLGLNMFVLFNVGGALENTYRTLDYLWLLVFTGIATMTTSLLLNDAVTIGASGIVFGCLGGVVAFGLKYRSLLPARYRNLMGDAAIPTVLGLLTIGLTSDGVDNWAHVGGLVAGLVTGAFMRPTLLADARRWWWEPAMRAAPSLTILLVVLGGPLLLGDVLPVMHTERDDDFGFSMPVPAAWVRGADPMGSTAWFNKLAGLGRASFAVEALEREGSADPWEAAKTFAEERLLPRRLGSEVLSVHPEPPEPTRVGDRDAVRVRAVLEETTGRTRLTAFFVPRGERVFQLVFFWPVAYPRYAHVADLMIGGVKFDEPHDLRLARAEALLFPNAPTSLAKLGAALLDQGEASSAAEALTVAVRGDPSNVGYRVLLARAWLTSGEVERSCEASRAAVLLEPEALLALEADARCEVARGNPVRALKRIQDARAVAPSDEHLRQVERKLEDAIGRSPASP